MHLPPPPHTHTPGGLGSRPFKGGGSVVVDLSFMYFPLFVGFQCWSLINMHYRVSKIVLQSS